MKAAVYHRTGGPEVLQVVPGDVLRLECTITKMRGPIGFGEAKASVNGELVCSGDLMFAIK